MVSIKATNSFNKVVKKLHSNQKGDLDLAVNTLIDNPLTGKEKKGDLKGVFVYKFKMNNQLTLLAYKFDEDPKVITLLALGSHQNFYRDLKDL